MKQIVLPFRPRGGKRKGAGRPRTRVHPGLNGRGVAHLKREEFAARNPLHITQRVQPGVGNLRSQLRSSLILAALRAAKRVRVIHYSIQGNHLHLVAEAADAHSLSRAMQGLASKIARGLNRLAWRRGAVFVDRYHSRALKTPREVANVLRYVQENRKHHFPESGRDELVSSIDSPLKTPSVWLLRVGWQRGAIDARSRGAS
jgi:putative transposase